MQGVVAGSEPQFVRDSCTWGGYILIGEYCFMIAALGPFMPFLREEQHLNYTVSALHFSAWAFGIVLAGAFGHRIIRRLGRNHAIWICGAGVPLCALIFILANYPVVTICGAFIGGISGSIMGQSINTVMADRFGEQRARAFTEANIAGSLCAMAAPFMVGLCVKLGLGWRLSITIPIIVHSLMFLLRRTVFGAHSSHAFEPPGGRLPSAYWLFWTVIWLSVASEWSIIFWASEFLEKARGIARADAAQAVTLFLVAMLIGRVSGIRLMRTYNAGNLLSISSAVALAGFIAFWLCDSAVLSLVGLFVAGLGTANVYPLSLAQAINRASGQTLLATSRMSLSTGSAVLCAPFVLGFVGDRAGIYVAYGTVALLLSTVLIILVVAGRVGARKSLNK